MNLQILNCDVVVSMKITFPMIQGKLVPGILIRNSDYDIQNVVVRNKDH